MFINADRMFTVSQARPKIHALLADAHQGRTAHVVKGSEIIANLVPPNARIVDDERLMAGIAELIVDRESDLVVADNRCSDEISGSSTELAGRFFAWAWLTDKHLFIAYLEQFQDALRRKLGRHISTAAVLRLLEHPMTASMGRGEIDAAILQARCRPPAVFRSDGETS